jgi:amidohydrolase
MAAPDEFHVIIHGVGGHAARPHEAIDPVVIAAECISAFQTIVSRSVDPTESAVVTIGRIEGGTAHNIIPEMLQLWGTIRSFSSATAKRIEQRMHQLCAGIAQAHSAEISLTINKGYPAVINDERAAKQVLNHAQSLFTSDKVVEMERPIMAGEDFSFYQQFFPGAFFFVGSGAQESDSTYVWHHPKYNVDPGFFETAMPLMVSLAIGGSGEAEIE